MQREIIVIDEEKCTGCGECIPNCPEGALQVIDGTARLVSDLFCDGLGACIGHCPEGAMTIEMREAEDYDEAKVMANVVTHGPNVIKAHLEHLKEHGQTQYLGEAVAYLAQHDIPNPLAAAPATSRLEIFTPRQGCPGSRVVDLRSDEEQPAAAESTTARRSSLRQWPVQIMLVPPQAPYLKEADLLIAADCVPFAYAPFHEDLLAGKVLLVGCPKLDDAAFYVEKIGEIFKQNDIRSVTVAKMEVPCCTGIEKITQQALTASGKTIPLNTITIGIKGEKQATTGG